MKVLSLKANKQYSSGSGWSYTIEYHTTDDDAKTMFINTLELSDRDDYMEIMKILIDSQVANKYNPSKDTVSTIIKYRGKENR